MDKVQINEITLYDWTCPMCGCENDENECRPLGEIECNECSNKFEAYY